MAAYIRQIKIDAFRALRDVDIDLMPPAGHAPFRHLILTGPNGSGKSSALLFIAQQIASRHSDAIRWSEPRDASTIAVYIPPDRKLNFRPVKGPARLERSETGTAISVNRAAMFLQFLVNLRTEQAFANIDKNTAREAALREWFDRFQKHLRWLFEDPKLELEFDVKNFTFTLRRGDGTTHGFEQLADGHAAFLFVFAEIVLAIDAVGQTADAAHGVVIVDELETHLHLSLQEQALPFLTTLFPRLQFITATHSPAVIASIPNAVVYDMAARTATVSDDFIGVRYGSLMTEHFRLPSDFDLDSTRKLEELRRLAVRDRTADEEARFRELAELLSRRSSTLNYEVWRTLHEPGPPVGMSEAS